MEFKTFAGVPTISNECEDTLKSNLNISNETVSESNCGLEKLLKLLRKENKKRKKLKKMVKKWIKQEKTKATENKPEETLEPNIQPSNPIKEKIGNFFHKVGEAIVKALPTVLASVAGIAAKFLFGKLNKTKGVLA